MNRALVACAFCATVLAFGPQEVYSQCQRGGGGSSQRTGSSGMPMQSNPYTQNSINPYQLAALQQQYALQQMQLNYMQQALTRQAIMQQQEYQRQLMEQRKLQAQLEKEQLEELKSENKAKKDLLTDRAKSKQKLAAAEKRVD
ncbi:MAG: hypothetical protein U0905_06905 [Pirellulales bacterium]